MLSSPEMKTQVEQLLSQIQSLSGNMEKLRAGLERPDGSPFRIHDADDWARLIYRSTLQRLLIFQQSNFQFIETLGLLALTRYVFELAVWIRLIRKNRGYALVFYAQQIDTMKRFYTDQASHFSREVALFKKLDAQEKKLTQEKTEDILAESDPGKKGILASKLAQSVQSEIDSECARNFSVMSDEATINGFGFQAYLIETKTILSAEHARTNCDNDLAAFNSTVPTAIKNLVPKRFNWSDMAKEVGMDQEYEYIYSYTSKLLHATPMSISTDHPNLELIEVRTFLRYILITYRDLIEIIQCEAF